MLMRNYPVLGKTAAYAVADKQRILNEAEFLEKVDTIAANAVADACTGSNPRPITPAEMSKLLNCIYYGKEIDF